MTVVFDPKKHCGGKTRAGTPCRQSKGARTKHRGRGKCSKHGGNTPNGRKFAADEAARAVLADLAVPVEGNPLQVLQSVLNSAHGVLEASRRMLASVPRDGTDEAAWAAVKLYREAIAEAGRMAKLAAEAVNEDALVKLDMAIGEEIKRVLFVALEAYERAGYGEVGRKAAEDALVAEMVAVGPSGDERN